MEAWQLFDFQTTNFAPQSVTNILTAVHATGSHVLWMNPPCSSAILENFVQYFLSNMATYWPRSDSCQFDVNVNETRLCATSTRHPRMKDPHTPNMCTKFSKFHDSICESGPSDSSGWTGAVAPASNRRQNQQTKSPLGHPRCHTWAEEGPLRTTNFQHPLGGTVSGCRFLAAPKQSNVSSNVLAQDPLKRALLPTLAGKTLICHCQAPEECRADALAQAYESEAMIHSQTFTPPQPSSKATHDWLAPQTGIGDILKDLRHAIVKIVSKHWLRNAAKAAWAVRSRSNDDILAATKSFLQSAGFHPHLSVHPNQPFRLGLIRNVLQLMQDPDVALIDIAKSGFHTGVFEPTGFSGIWRRQQTEPREISF